MGPENARHAAKEALNDTPAKLAITCGFAGGLDPRHPVGTILFQADAAFPSPAALIESGAMPGSILTLDRVLITREDKARCRQNNLTADAVDMESGILRACCAAAGVPSATVRVISDAAEEDLPLDFNSLMDETCRLSPARLAAAIATAPWTIPRLIQFGAQTAEAAQILARAVWRIVGS
jgi:adenosylhomocysteine nucleosidase